MDEIRIYGDEGNDEEDYAKPDEALQEDKQLLTTQCEHITTNMNPTAPTATPFHLDTENSSLVNFNWPTLCLQMRSQFAQEKDTEPSAAWQQTEYQIGQNLVCWSQLVMSAAALGSSSLQQTVNTALLATPVLKMLDGQPATHSFSGLNLDLHIDTNYSSSNGQIGSGHSPHPNSAISRDAFVSTNSTPNINLNHSHMSAEQNTTSGMYSFAFKSGLSPCRPLQQASKAPLPSTKMHVKKPLNAFMLFMKEMRPRVVAECTLKESAAINQILGRRWHGLSREEQAKYYEMARREKELHLQLYPGWSARENYAYQAGKRKSKKSAPPITHNGQSERTTKRTIQTTTNE